MNKFVTTAAMLLMTVSAATAEMKSVFNQGAWNISIGSPDGTPNDKVCVAQTSGDQIYYGLKYFGADNMFVIHIQKDTWKIPPDTKIDFEMEFDKMGPWGFSGTVHFEDESMIETAFSKSEDVNLFLEEFSKARRMYVRFPGNEQLWQLGMSGSSAAIDVFQYCIRSVAKHFRNNTQPFEPKPQTPSQPFESKPSQTQPFTTTPTDKDKRA